MPAFRYLALAALVVWLGLTFVVLGRELGRDLVARFELIAAGCGAVVFVALFIMKFVGPPPRAFTLRAGIVFVMLASTILASTVPEYAVGALGLNAALGLLLLYWYSNE